MSHLLIRPDTARSERKWHGCTPRIARALSLYSWRRCVTVDRGLRHVLIETSWLWFGRHTRVVSFDRIARVVCRAQALPTGFSIRRFFSNRDSGVLAEVAFFFIALELKDSTEEVPLCTLLESVPRERGPLRRLLAAVDGSDDGPARIGDEGMSAVMHELREYLGLIRRRE